MNNGFKAQKNESETSLSDLPGLQAIGVTFTGIVLKGKCKASSFKRGVF